MLKISEFSKLTRISIHMLRHYDEINLLKPSFVDQETQYRYYSLDQLPIANNINALKQIGLSLQDIIDIINQKDNIKSTYKVKIENQLAKKLIEKEKLDNQIKRMKNVLKDNAFDKHDKFKVSVNLIPEMQVAKYRGIIPSYQDEGLLWKMLDSKIPQFNDGYTIATFYDNDSEEGIDVEVMREVKGKGKFTDETIYKSLPEIKVASIVYYGNYDKLAEVNSEIINWVAVNDYQLAGNLFNIYHRSPQHEQNWNEFITEVCIPIK